MDILSKTTTIATFRDWSLQQREPLPDIPYNVAAWNAGGADAPYIRPEQKIGNVYYSITQSAVAPTDWLNFSLYTSTDLRNWEPSEDNPVITASETGDTGYMAHPSLKQIGDLWHIYYSANGEYGDGSIWLRTAPSLSGPWTKVGEVYAGHVGSGFTSHANLPCVIDDGTQLIMYYWTKNLGSQSNPDMEYATSPLGDGITWTYGGTILSRAVGDWDYDSRNSGFDPWIIRNPSGYYEMIYTAYMLVGAQKLGTALSVDPFHFVKFQGPIVGGSGVAGAWDEVYPGDGVLYFPPGSDDVWLWFAGCNASLIAQGGLYKLIAPTGQQRRRPTTRHRHPRTCAARHACPRRRREHEQHEKEHVAPWDSSTS